MSYILVVIVILIAVLATLLVGHSRENTKGDPTYGQNMGKKWTRLTMFYIVSAVASIVLLAIYIVTQ